MRWSNIWCRSARIRRRQTHPRYHACRMPLVLRRPKALLVAEGRTPETCAKTGARSPTKARTDVSAQTSTRAHVGTSVRATHYAQQKKGRACLYRADPTQPLLLFQPLLALLHDNATRWPRRCPIAGARQNLAGSSSDLPVGRKPRNSRPHPTWKVGRSARMIPLWVHSPCRHLHIPASGYAPTVAMRVRNEPARALVLPAPRATGAFFLPPRLTCTQNGIQCAKCLQQGLLEPISPTAASDSATGL